MAAFKIAIRSLLRRKVRMSLIGLLVVVGTVLIVFGGTFAASAKAESRQAIIDSFTGDLVLYSERSKDVPSPFSFQTPLPVIENVAALQKWLADNPAVGASVAIAQNYGLVSVEKDGKKFDMPLIFYAVDPLAYRKTFDNLAIQAGENFGPEGSPTASGLLISQYQLKAYQDKYGVTMVPGQKVKLLSLTGGGSVNSVDSQLLGIFEPKHYANVFNYINFMDITSYSRLYNFTGVSSASLPTGLSQAFAATSDEDIFGLASTQAFDKIDVGALKKEELTGYTLVNVKLKDHTAAAAFLEDLARQGFAVKSIGWEKASSFFATVADILQAVILGATVLIFLIVVFILMNTLIINILERTPEIGTLRAIGADKSFVSAIFLWESVILNFGAALLGILVSLVLILSIGPGGIQLPDLVSQYLVGGGPLKLIVTPGPFVLGLVLVLAVSFLATLYPTRVATNVSPLKAMSGK